ncbi:MAG: peptidoglycan editing factor PgeF, partial [Azoarcus sp.]|nr:peptidoglycan editing factor PgeF [Azoarcus sp.]
PVRADAAVARKPGAVCAVMTADCLPVLFCDEWGETVAAAHAGWRGLAAGVLEATLAAMATPPERIMAWLGPAIGPAAFEVGDEVREAFLARDPGAQTAFAAQQARGKWFADLFALARRRLARARVGRVYGGGICTFTEIERFYSYRREGATGRFASLVWLEEF